MSEVHAHVHDGSGDESSHSGAVWAAAATNAAAHHHAGGSGGAYTGPAGPAGGVDQPPSPNHARAHGGGGGGAHRSHHHNNGGAAVGVARQPAIPEGGVGMGVGAGGTVNAWGSSGASGMEASATSQHGAAPISGAAARVNPATGQVIPPVRPSSEKRLARLNHDDHTWCCQKLLPPQQAPAAAVGADGKTPSGPSKLSGNEFGMYMASWSHIGARRHMEDRHRVVYRPPNDLPPPPATLPNTTGGSGLVRGYCGVFDGHGGEEIAHHCGENLHVNIFECLREEYKRMASKAQAQAALHQANAQYNAAFNATYGAQQPGGGSVGVGGSNNSPNHAAANPNGGGGGGGGNNPPATLASTTVMMTNVSQTNLLPGQNTHTNSSNNGGGQAGSNSVQATPPMGAQQGSVTTVPLVPLAGLSAPNTAAGANPMISPHSTGGNSQTASVTVLGQLMASNAAGNGAGGPMPSPGGAAPATQRDSETNVMAKGQSKSDLNARVGGRGAQQGPADDSPHNPRKPPSPAFGQMVSSAAGPAAGAANSGTPTNAQVAAAAAAGGAPAMQHQGSLRTMKDRQRTSMKGTGQSTNQLNNAPGAAAPAAGAGAGGNPAQGLVMGQTHVQQLSPAGHQQQQATAGGGAAQAYAYDTREPDAMSQSATSMSHSSYQPSGAPVAAPAGQGVTQIRDEDLVKRAIRRGFEKTERHILEYSSRHGFRDGSTAVVIVVVGNTLYCANVGDSRAIMCRNGKVVHLSEDHKPHNANERKRIETAGGQVRAVMTEKAVCCCFGTMQVPKGALRLWPGGFSVSRTLGDIDYKVLRRGKIASTDILIATPDILMMPLTPEDEFCVLGSDGLWDVISNDEAVEFVRSAKLKAPAGAFDPEGTAKKLVELAYTRGSEDNITAIVLFFTPQTAPSAAAYH